MSYYPIFLDLKDKNVLVVGGGKVAERKILNLLRYGCRIHVVSPELTSQLEKLVVEKRIQHIPEQSLNQAMDEASMVIAATDDPAVNGQIASRAKEKGLLIRKELQTWFGSEYGSLAKLLGMLRTEVLAQGDTSSENKPFFENLVNSDLLELIRTGDIDGIRATLRSTLGASFPVDDIVKRVFKKQTRREVDKGKG